MTEEEKNEQDTGTLLKYFGAHLYLYLTLPYQVSASMADDTEDSSTAELQMPESQERNALQKCLQRPSPLEESSADPPGSPLSEPSGEGTCRTSSTSATSETQTRTRGSAEWINEGRIKATWLIQLLEFVKDDLC
ncbi:hypothetical protein AALO_G00283580 [Alosa alosa]|uniref:Uncharacterized protein n=1 Tax=Alosa alosa TaxID=278164 RepID=A0AAV6FKH1_9TELE|nr:hypothetical protein AALO_G00283580 [Alosa alosa]